MVPGVQKITDIDALLSLAAEWEALDASLHPRVPFSSPIWCTNWWKSFKRDTLFARDELNSYALRDTAGNLVCVAPMFVSHRPGRGAVRSRELQFFGADQNVTELRGPICKPEWMANAVDLLSEQIKIDRCCDWVQWRGLRVPDDASRWQSEISLHDEMQTINYVLSLPETWQALRSSLPRNIKESLRKCYNSLARDSHAFEIRIIELPQDIPAALEKFFQLHRSRATAGDMHRHHDAFKHAAARDILTNYCWDMAWQGHLKIFQMVIRDRVVATRVGFALGDELYLYYSGFDVEWQRYSVMTTLVAEAIKWAIAQGLKHVNLSTGTDVSKTRWRPESIVYHGGVALASDLRSRSSFYVVDRLRRMSRI
jgi:CelD/BcsL family acetyltransferase involved in cellulose biosynthesis